jgi:integral membrane protein (TIGR01906 family)
MLKTLVITIRVIFVLCLPLLLISASLAAAANCQALYLHGFQKYDVAATTGLAAGELEKTADAIIGYWNNSEELLDVTVIKDGQPFTLFNEKEIRHMADVKKLFGLDYLILAGTLGYSFLYGLPLLLRRQRRKLAQDIVAGSALTLLLVFIIGVSALTDFDRFFTNFHLLSFSNDLWLLNPATDYLLMLFPGGFWQDAATYCLVAVIVAAFIPQLAATAFITQRTARRAATRGDSTLHWRR